MKLCKFRIRLVRGSWRIETWEALPPYGPGWQPVYTGAPTLDDARAFFGTAKTLIWADGSHMTGEYSFV